MSSERINPDQVYTPKKELSMEEWIELFQKAEAVAREHSNSPEQIEMRRRVARAAFVAGQAVLC